MQTNSPSSPTSRDRIVIIGAGQAGGWAARTLRNEGFAGTIMLVGDESWPPHERPPLSKNVLAGEAHPDSTYLFSQSELVSLNIDWRKNCKAISIDCETHTVTLENNGTLGWDRLILCTGGHARSLSISGLENPCMTLRTIDDADRLRQRLQKSTRLLIVGGGWIGLEVGATANRLGVDVTIIEAAAQICGRSLPTHAAKLVEALHKKNGVKILLNRKILNATKDTQESVTIQLGASESGLTDAIREQAIGETLIFDTILAGIGMVPNDDIARSAGIACANGIIVDQYCQTSVPLIYAAGDVAINTNHHGDPLFRLESWQNAQQQGIAAARSALGIKEPYLPVPWFWSDQFGVNIQILGTTNETNQPIVRGGSSDLDIEAGTMFFYLHEGMVRGVIGFNAGRDIRIARRLIETKSRPDRRLLADPSVPLKSLV